MAEKNKKSAGILQRLLAESEADYEKTATRMRLAIKIADAIKAAGMTRKEFAARMKKQPSEISRWLSGTHNFTIDTLQDISKALRINLIDAEGARRSAPISDYSYTVYVSANYPVSLKQRAAKITETDTEWSRIPFELLTTNNRRYAKYSRPSI